MRDELEVYYNINLQIWSEDGENFVFHVTQEFDEAGRDSETLAYGDEASFADAVNFSKAAIDEALS
jgi:hypothetical protein